MAIHVKALNEYKEFLTRYLFPLLGISHKVEELSRIENSDYMEAVVAQRDGKLYFSTDKDTVFSLDYSELTDDNRRLAINIVQSFFNVSKYRMTSENEVVKHMYYSDIQKDANYKMAIQKGICNRRCSRCFSVE